MKKSLKKGITASVLLIAIVIMSVLISTATIVGTNSIKSANFEEYKSEVSRLHDVVNQYYVKNGNLPVKNEIVAVDSMPDELKAAIFSKGDINDNLYVVDMSKLNNTTITKGRGSIDTSDVFLVAQNSQNVYYLDGYLYKSKIYYTN